MDYRPSLTLSILVTTRDRPAALARCLDSLAAAALRFAELIVVDDGSEPAATVDLHGARLPLTLLRSPRARGEAAARNRAAAAALGELLVFLAGDLLLGAQSLDAVERAFLADPLLGVLLAPAQGRDLDTAAGPAAAFDCGLLAIRDRVFREHGGFLDSPSNGLTLELLMRLAHGGVRLVVRPEIEVTAQTGITLPRAARSAFRNGIAWAALRDNRRGLDEQASWWAVQHARVRARSLSPGRSARRLVLRATAELAFSAGNFLTRMRYTSPLRSRPRSRDTELALARILAPAHAWDTLARDQATAIRSCEDPADTGSLSA